MLLTRSPLVYPRRGLTARLACVKHAASVRPEPGSNSPLKNIYRPRAKPAECRQRKEITFNQNNPSKKQNCPSQRNTVTTTHKHEHGGRRLMHNSALTFGTLLSSQESDAHHQRPLSQSPGQPVQPYRFDSASQIRLSRSGPPRASSAGSARERDSAS